MHIILCLDDKNGMTFNGRRQSRDRAVVDHILKDIGTQPLWMNAYSEKLFADTANTICVDENFLSYGEKGAYCFVENADVTPYASEIEDIIIYRWNRVYPADMHFPNDVIGNRVLTGIKQFSGNSHDIITQEVYSL